MNSQTPAPTLALTEQADSRCGYRAFTPFRCRPLPDAPLPWGNNNKKTPLFFSEFLLHSQTPAQNVPWHLVFDSTPQQALPFVNCPLLEPWAPKLYDQTLTKPHPTPQLFPVDKRADRKFPAGLFPQINPSKSRKNGPVNLHSPPTYMGPTECCNMPGSWVCSTVNPSTDPTQWLRSISHVRRPSQTLPLVSICPLPSSEELDSLILAVFTETLKIIKYCFPKFNWDLVKNDLIFFGKPFFPDPFSGESVQWTPHQNQPDGEGKHFKWVNFTKKLITTKINFSS